MSLEIPKVLEITTRVGCTVDCSYCPQDVFTKNYSERSNITQMSFDTFKKCIDKIPKHLEIAFSGFTEPFLNPECIKMIEYANSQNFKINIFTTTVGITKADINILRKIKFHTFGVHLPDNKGAVKIELDENYFNIMDKLIENIPNIFFLLTRGPNLSEGVHPKVKEYLKKKKKFVFNHMMHLRCGNVDIKGLSLHRINGSLRYCSRLKGNVLLPNGDVVFCCMDFGQKHILGNLLSSDYDSLFKSDEYVKVLRGMKDDSIDILCRYCFMYADRSNIIFRYYDFFRYRLSYFLKINALALINSVSNKFQKYTN